MHPRFETILKEIDSFEFFSEEEKINFVGIFIYFLVYENVGFRYLVASDKIKKLGELGTGELALSSAINFLRSGIANAKDPKKFVEENNNLYEIVKLFYYLHPIESMRVCMKLISLFSKKTREGFETDLGVSPFLVCIAALFHDASTFPVSAQIYDKKSGGTDTFNHTHPELKKGDDPKGIFLPLKNFLDSFQINTESDKNFLSSWGRLIEIIGYTNYIGDPTERVLQPQSFLGKEKDHERRYTILASLMIISDVFTQLAHKDWIEMRKALLSFGAREKRGEFPPGLARIAHQAITVFVRYIKKEGGKDSDLWRFLIEETAYGKNIVSVSDWPTKYSIFWEMWIEALLSGGTFSPTSEAVKLLHVNKQPTTLRSGY